jgi:tripeptide aminopeptidase
MINRERIVKEFCRLVSIDSVSYKERELADAMIQSLEELGFEVEEDSAGEHYNGNCGNLYGYLPGNVEGDPILFSSHLDTVEPGIGKTAIVHEDGTITSDGTTVLGADDISGLVSILEAVRSIKEQGLPHRSIEVLFPIAEEVYLRGTEVFDFSKIKAKEAYVLDLDGPVGRAAIQAPTLLSFTIKIIGKAAHAGFAPEQGINAIAIAAQAISRIRQGRIGEGMTVNIGTIEGGKARNIVSEECVLRGEVRSSQHEKAVAEIELIEAVIREITEEYQAKYEFETSIGCLAYEIAKDHPVITRFQKACDKIDCPVELVSTFGGSDNNNFVKNGITGIVMSCGMNQVHSCKEYTEIDELERCTSILINLLTDRE